MSKYYKHRNEIYGIHKVPKISKQVHMNAFSILKTMHPDSKEQLYF